MTNPEREASDKQLPDASTVSTEVQECARFFCTTLTNLNRISEEHIKVLLNIAYTAAEMARSLSSSKLDEGTQSTARKEGDELSELAGQLRSAAEGLSQNSIGLQAEIKAGTHSAAANSDTFCDKVEATLILAMQNSTTLQGQLNITGQAILTMAAAKLLSIALPNQ